MGGTILHLYSRNKGNGDTFSAPFIAVPCRFGPALAGRLLKQEINLMANRQTIPAQSQRYADAAFNPARDMYIQIAVETPVNLTRRHLELPKEFDTEARNNSHESEGFFSKAKAFWDGFGG
jgi:hypothetical protein